MLEKKKSVEKKNIDIIVMEVSGLWKEVGMSGSRRQSEREAGRCFCNAAPDEIRAGQEPSAQNSGKCLVSFHSCNSFMM